MFKGFQKPKRLVANTETLNERYGMFTAQPFERHELAAIEPAVVDFIFFAVYGQVNRLWPGAADGPGSG